MQRLMGRVRSEVAKFVERGGENAVDFIVLEGRRFNAATPVSCAHRKESGRLLSPSRPASSLSWRKPCVDSSPAAFQSVVASVRRSVCAIIGAVQAIVIHAAKAISSSAKVIVAQASDVISAKAAHVAATKSTHVTSADPATHVASTSTSAAATASLCTRGKKAPGKQRARQNH